MMLLALSGGVIPCRIELEVLLLKLKVSLGQTHSLYNIEYIV